MAKTRKNQWQKIMNHLKKRRLSVQFAKSKYGIQNLRARICELRKEGNEIYTYPDRRTGRTTSYGLNG